MKTIYLIREMKLIGATFNIYSKTTVKDEHRPYQTHYYRESEKPIGYNMEENEYLPYFAKVTEDLPSSCRGLKPEVYERCQLTTEFPGNYLVFEDTKTKKRLKIAMNSHTYEPIN